MSIHDSAGERELLRLLTEPEGEAGGPSAERAEELRRRLAREPELAARFRRLEAVWNGLEAPPGGLPPGFSRRLAARALAEHRGAGGPLTWRAAPVWVRAAAALALVLGVFAGSRLPAPSSGDGQTLEAALVEVEPSLAEIYLSALEEGPEAWNGSGGPAREEVER